jgi:hypothetical protein
MSGRAAAYLLFSLPLEFTRQVCQVIGMLFLAQDIPRALPCRLRTLREPSTGDLTGSQARAEEQLLRSIRVHLRRAGCPMHSYLECP